MRYQYAVESSTVSSLSDRVSTSMTAPMRMWESTVPWFDGWSRTRRSGDFTTAHVERMLRTGVGGSATRSVRAGPPHDATVRAIDSPRHAINEAFTLFTQRRVEIEPLTTYISSRMKRNPHQRLVLSLIFLVWTTGTVGAFSLGLSGFATGQILAAQGYGPKLQYGGGGSLDMRFPVLSWLDIATNLDFFGVAATDLSGNFGYRGFSAGDLAVLAEARALIGQWSGFGRLEAGGGMGVAGAIAAYQYTELYFFSPELRAEGFVAWVPSFLPGFDLRLSIPLAWQLRRDVDYSFSASAMLSVAYTLRSGK